MKPTKQPFENIRKGASAMELALQWATMDEAAKLADKPVFWLREYFQDVFMECLKQPPACGLYGGFKTCHNRMHFFRANKIWWLNVLPEIVARWESQWTPVVADNRLRAINIGRDILNGASFDDIALSNQLSYQRCQQIFKWIIEKCVVSNISVCMKHNSLSTIVMRSEKAFWLKELDRLEIQWKLTKETA